jgi:phosphoribosyl-dephospho-CoA transferase
MGCGLTAHDLLALRELPMPMADEMPAWLPSAFALAPFAVVRRADAPPGAIAVGFRGAMRAQRYGTLISRDAIVTVLSPEQLRDRPVQAARNALNVFRALRFIADNRLLGEHAWGPTGSVGFELATGRATATETSDLDLLIRSPSPMQRSDARGVRERLQEVERAVGVRIDAQLETPGGGVALNEWAEGKPRVMVRSASGPSLIHDPWATLDRLSEARC